MGGGSYERFAEIAAEFVRLKVDVIVTAATAPVVAAKQATSVISIVFAVAGDPIGSGLVESLGAQVATSPACRSSRPTLLPSGSNSCASSCGSPPISDYGQCRQSHDRAGTT